MQPRYVFCGRVRREDYKLGTISQAATEDELLSSQMIDAIQLMENEIGREPDSFWISKTVDDKDSYPPNSWQGCVQMLEAAGYCLVCETDMHKKFRSPTMASGLGATNVGVGYGVGPLGLGGTFTGGRFFIRTIGYRPSTRKCWLYSEHRE